MAEKPRLAWPDIAKGIAMLAIVVHHMGYYRPTFFAALFDVPLFFFISGYFLTSKPIPFEDFAKKKAYQLIRPYLIIGFCLVAVSLASSLLSGAGDHLFDSPLHWCVALACGTAEQPDFLPMPGIGAIWFLLALFWAALLTKRFLVNKPHAFWIMIAFVLFGCGTTQIVVLPWSLQAGCFATLFVYAGWYAKENQLLEAKPQPRFVLLLFFIVGLAYYAGTRSMMSTVVFEPLAVLAAFASLLLVVFLCKYILQKVPLVSPFFQYIGRNTLVVLGAHLVEQNYLNLQAYIPALAAALGGHEIIAAALILAAKIAVYLAAVVAVNLVKKAYVSLKAQKAAPCEGERLS